MVVGGLVVVALVACPRRWEGFRHGVNGPRVDDERGGSGRWSCQFRVVRIFCDTAVEVQPEEC